MQIDENSNLPTHNQVVLGSSPSGTTANALEPLQTLRL